jgi:endonuclease YncB( thermonuclease family)
VLQRIALVLTGVALVAALWIGGQSMTKAPRTDREAHPHATAALRASDTRADAETGRPAGKQNPDARLIAPDSIATPDISGPLERVPPRTPPAAAIKPLTLKREFFGPPIPQGTLLYRPVAIAAGEIEADGYRVRLAGIKVTPAGRACAGEDGKSWPCGAAARTALRSWMRGRAVACDVPSKPMDITTHCTLDGEDMALWLARNGWSQSANGQYDDAEAEAKREKRGMFGPSPLGSSAE